MMKKLISLMIAAALLLCAAACAGKDKKTEDPTDSQQSGEYGDEAITSVDVLDPEGNRLGSIRANGAVTFTDAGILYSVLNDRTMKAEFRLFDPKTGKDASLGTIEDFFYEASYCRQELGGKIYTLIQTGNVYDSAPDPLILLEFDPVNGTMNKYRVEENGFAYSAMAAVNGKLLIIDHDQEDVLHDRLICFDPASGEMSEKLSFELDEKGDTLRGVCAYKDGFCLLRVKFDGGKRMFIDRYDGSFRPIDSMEVSDLLKAAAVTLTPEDAENEFNQWVSRFFVTEESVFYYESFSVLRCLAVLETGEQLIFANDLFNASSGSGEPVFYWIYGGNDGEQNGLFALNGKKFEAAEHGFKLPYERCYTDFVSVCANGGRIVGVSCADNGTDLPPLVYCIPNGK